MIKTLVLAAAAFAAVPASAQDAPISMNVGYGDLNLASAQGAAIFKARVKSAARQLCGVEQAPGLAESIAVKSCRADVMASAEPQMLAARGGAGSGRIVVAASR